VYYIATFLFKALFCLAGLHIQTKLPKYNSRLHRVFVDKNRTSDSVDITFTFVVVVVVVVIINIIIIIIININIIAACG
jgi:hypothetical protein